MTGLLPRTFTAMALFAMAWLTAGVCGRAQSTEGYLDVFYDSELGQVFAFAGTYPDYETLTYYDPKVDVSLWCSDNICSGWNNTFTVDYGTYVYAEISWPAKAGVTYYAYATHSLMLNWMAFDPEIYAYWDYYGYSSGPPYVIRVQVWGPLPSWVRWLPPLAAALLYAEIIDLGSSEAEMSLPPIQSISITSVQCPNDNADVPWPWFASFTTKSGENNMSLMATLSPLEAEASYSSRIRWNVREIAECTSIPNPPSGSYASVYVTDSLVTPAPNGRTQAISYGVTASIDVGVTHRESSEALVIQDGIDKLRQQYLDMQKNSVPDRSNFALDLPATPHFQFSEGACHCGQHDWQLWLIMDNLEAVRVSFAHPMIVNSGYRCPIHNSHQPGAAVNSRHIYGMAADIDVSDFNGDGTVNKDDWDILAEAATANGAVLEPYSQTGGWVHMQW